MLLFFWDAGALAKRYTLEIGSAVVATVFASGIPAVEKSALSFDVGTGTLGKPHGLF
jgi:hypothetical protein